jgi:hypothetical protein
MSSKRLTEYLYYVFAAIIAVSLYFISKYSVTLLLVVLIMLTILSVLIVYKNLFLKNLESKHFIVGAIVIIIIICDLIVMLDDDVVNATLCNTFLNGSILSHEVEEEYETDTQEGTEVETKLYFSPATKSDED